MKVFFKKILSCLLATACLVGCATMASAAGKEDYKIWKWARAESGGKVEQLAADTVKVTGRGVWDPADVDELCAITYKEEAPWNGFKARMTFHNHYGTNAQDGWYGIMLNNKAYPLCDNSKYNTKGVMILFKINRAQRARKQVTIELSTVDRSGGIANIVGNSIVMSNLTTDWQVDVEIKDGGKLYICGALCYDISSALNKMLGSGKMYPSFMGFAEDYREVSFTAQYAQKPASQATTSRRDPASSPSTAPAKTTAGGPKVTTTTRTNNGTVRPGETTVSADPSATDSTAPSDSSDGSTQTDTSDTGFTTDSTASISADDSSAPAVTTADQPTDTPPSAPKTWPIVVGILAALVVAGGAVVFLIWRKKSK